MRNLKKIILLAILICLLYSCKQSDKTERIISLSNTSSINLTSKAVVIERTSLFGAPDNIFPLLQNQHGDTISCQLDDLDGDGSWDQLFFVTDVAAESKLLLKLSWLKTDPKYPVKTSVRFGKRDSEETTVYQKTSDTLLANELSWVLGYQPYQTDGPMWENDKVGFRHYFDGRNSNDLFGKKAPIMSPDSVGVNQYGVVEDNYHQMWDWGRDILLVGTSLGIGGFGLMIDDSIVRVGVKQGAPINNIERTIFTILTEGPVHTVMQFEYQNWKPVDRIYTAKEITSIWPGVYAYKNNVEIEGLQGDETLLIGLVNARTDETLAVTETDQMVILYTHDKQDYEKQWYIGLGLIVPKDNYLGYGEIIDDNQQIAGTYYAKLSIENAKPINYFTSACWELGDERFTDSLYFENYLINLAEQISTELDIKVDEISDEEVLFHLVK